MKGEEAYPLEWIDEYVVRLRDYVFVREEDCLLIKVPNEAHKLNPSGIRIMKRLLGGEGILNLWGSYGSSARVRRDLYHFFVGLKQVLQGCLNEHDLPEVVVNRPFALGFNTLPVLSEVALTYRCNLDCGFCYAGCSCRRDGTKAPAVVPPAKEMTSAEVREVLRIIREEAEVPSVSFTGGEPTLRDDLADLVRYARRELGLRVNLITNGTLIDGTLAKRLKAAGLNSAQVSLESPDDAVHDALTQVPGAHRRAVQGIKHLQENGIIVHTNTTINRRNIDSAIAMPAFVRSLGLERFSMNLVIPVGKSATVPPKVLYSPVPEQGLSLICPGDLNLQYSEIPDLLLRIQEEAARCEVEFMWYSPTPICIFNPIQYRLGNKGCAACDGLLSVSPTGDVLPCSSWPESVGNLLHERFRDVWDSARARWMRDKAFAPLVCRDCADLALCQGGCPLYWEYFGHDELEKYGASYVAAHC
ncbi:MAG TPA: radical SAM protein [Candidatus Hydrogenedentes bacterium]|nr:radical SAM protein [Candidatus Hydrogenedentota bacterium]